MLSRRPGTTLMRVNIHSTEARCRVALGHSWFEAAVAKFALRPRPELTICTSIHDEHAIVSNWRFSLEHRACHHCVQCAAAPMSKHLSVLWRRLPVNHV